MHCSYFNRWFNRSRMDGHILTNFLHLIGETAVHCFIKKCLNNSITPTATMSNSTTPTSRPLQKPTLAFCLLKKLLFLTGLSRIQWRSTAGASRAQALPMTQCALPKSHRRWMHYTYIILKLVTYTAVLLDKSFTRKLVSPEFKW